MVKLDYCDWIADFIRKKMLKGEEGEFSKLVLDKVSSVKWDLSKEGYYLSSKKTIFLEDQMGTKYKVTVESLD